MTKPEFQNDSDAIRNACKLLMTAANSSDADLWASLYTPDAVLMPPNLPSLNGPEVLICTEK